ncbi:ABC transporter substrate-binding protein [Roseomonas sp. USHLN139]|uniref:ABC transporter substrate-binding protein n=1 Tax=Roseomonas sp. USHLN139 TaxID=3081298 RepID=UPI003B0214F3
MHRRSLIAGLLAATLAAPRLARAAGPVEITDIMGRKVRLAKPATRIALTQARHVLAMGLIHPEPVSLVTGWGDDLRTMNPPDYAAVRSRFPAAEAVPVIARGRNGGLSVEALLAGAPELVIASLASLGPYGGDLPDRLTAMGIPVVVIDFFVDPMANTERSMAILGQVLGREAEARRFEEFYAGGRQQIAGRLRGVTQRPRVFVHAHAGGIPCCSSPGRGAFSTMIGFAGGHNIGADLLPTNTGDLSLEQVIAADPWLYVATGGPYGTRGGIPLGQGIAPEAAATALAAVIRRSRLEVLPAVQAGRAHAIWHGFNDTPAHLVMLQALARWCHPDRCGDLDPAATLAQLNERFLAIPMQGAHWADLPAGGL